MCEAIKVIARCRPLNAQEIEANTEVVVTVDAAHRQCCLRKGSTNDKSSKLYTFDGVYGPHSTTEKIYTDIVQPIVESVVQGYNGTVFAYGQTSCGKTFTMQGLAKPNSKRGIIPRCCQHILKGVQNNSYHSNCKYLLHVSYLEIYNEEIRDLLVKDSRCRLEIKEHPDRGMYVKGLSSITVDSYDDMEKIIESGGKHRSVGATLLNADSSRSHCIFIVDLEVCVQNEDEEFYRKGKLNLVDLAGSERQRKSGATGERLREATRINLSLSVLGNVISSLVDGKSKHVPYRDSKLTRLLQDSIGGNSKTLMIACISPGVNNYEETLSTLRYAKRAKNIKNKPRINEDPKDNLIRKYQDEIKVLRHLIAKELQSPAGALEHLLSK